MAIVENAGPFTKRGEPYCLAFPLFNEVGLLAYADNVTALISVDGDTFVPTTNSVESIDASGMYLLDLTAAETDGALIIILINTNTAGIISAPIVLYPEHNDFADTLFDVVVPGPYGANTFGGIIGGMVNKTPVLHVMSPVLQDGNIRLVKGNDYKELDGRQLTWTERGGGWPDLTDATVLFIIHRPSFFSQQVEITQATGNAKSLAVELTSEQTQRFDSRTYTYELEATLSSGSIVTLLQGHIQIIPSL